MKHSLIIPVLRRSNYMNSTKESTPTRMWSAVMEGISGGCSKCKMQRIISSSSC
uniref:Uncharacterized protein n=1 Tax=Parascaris univalens TaxID=6257 RepID=A0A915A3Z0_PARUN